MNVVTLAQLILLILQNKNIKPKKHKLNTISIALAQYILGVQINKLNLPTSTIYYYINKLGIKKRRERTKISNITCPKCKSNKIIKKDPQEETNTNAKTAQHFMKPKPTTQQKRTTSNKHVCTQYEHKEYF